MTLVIALEWLMEEDKMGVVVSSDSKITAGPMSYEERKIYPILLPAEGEPVPIAIAGGAGNASIIKQTYEMCYRILTDLCIREWYGKTPTFEQFEDAIKMIEKALISRFRELGEQGIEVEFEMILASVDIDGRVSIYRFDDRGMAEPVHYNPGFAMIGMGSLTGGRMLLKLLGYSPETIHMMDMGLLSTFIIDTVSETDNTVGPFVGESYYMGSENGEVVMKPLAKPGSEEYKRMAKQMKDFIKRLWILYNSVDEEKISEKLDELENRPSADLQA